MKSLSASLVTVALFAAGAAAQTFQINTPNPPTQCVPTQFTWSGGTPQMCEADVQFPSSAPYFLALTPSSSINPGGQTGAAALQQYSGLTGTSFTWSSNISAGTSIGLSLTDSTGATALSAPVTILSGPDSSCLNGGASTGAGSTGASTSAAGTTAAGTSAAGTTSAAGSSGTATTPTGSGTTSKASGTNSGSGTSSTASATGGSSGSNGAMSNAASAGVVGIIGAVAAALLA
ncbi:hypothetical protein C8T65DRAFT_693277 [Cerioporus squamosus]|nr:hypothetical protein C8T65DRAFT_693277 [Cerioporus squamosus]